jgi:hypothetical protein
MTVPHSDIPGDVREFIHTCIDSAAQLEILLLLAGKRERAWNASEVSDELRSEPNLVASVLADLMDKGLLSAEATVPPSSLTTRYRYSPHKSADDPVVMSLMQLYKERRHSIMNMIYNKPPASAPSARGIQAFADAFRWNTKKEDH